VIAVPPTTPAHDWGDLGDERSQRRFEAIAVELAERYREILPRNRNSRGMGTKHSSRSRFCIPSLSHQSARHLQEFVRCAVKDWPDADSQPHVTVTDQQVRVWYGTDDESAAAVRWRPFDRMLFQS
jgi:hypothetical protein